MDLFALTPTTRHYVLADANTLSGLTIRPAEKQDVQLLLEMHQRLSNESLYKRYHSLRPPTRDELEKICALAESDGRVIVAAVSGEPIRIVGMAYYVRSGSDSAETAFLIEDGYQGLGIGRRLMRHLTQAAFKQGIRYFDAYVLPSNEVMINLLQQSGRLVHNRVGYGARLIRVRLDKINE